MPIRSAIRGSRGRENPSPIPTMREEIDLTSPTPSPPRPLSRTLKNLGVILNSKRIRKYAPMRGLASGRLDFDQTGTYDPKLLRATPPRTPPPPRVKRTKTVGEISEGNEKTRKYRRVGYNYPMAMKFTTEKALKYLRSITPGPYPSKSTSANEEASSYDSDEDTRRHSRRKLRQPKRFGNRIRKDGLSVHDLTSGHPQRRGCKACFNSGNDDCSLIEHDQIYPCAACDDASIDCQLIIPPEFKKVCERCKRKRISCSYRLDGGKGVDSCESCEEVDAACCAAPLQDASYAKRYENASKASRRTPQPTRQVVPRQFVSCNQCRNGGSKCNLKRDQPGPCRHCRKKDEQCAFTLLPKSTRSFSSRTRVRMDFGGKIGTSKSNNKGKGKGRAQSEEIEDYPSSYRDRIREEVLRAAARQKYRKQRPKKTNKKRSRNRNSSRNQSPSPEPISITNGIRHTTISTAFAHPIKFNYIPAPDGRAPCSFCAHPFFGLAGHGMSNVTVIPYPDGYEEVGISEFEKGHHQRGQDYTTMCEPCTFSRVRAMTCSAHSMRPIEDLDPRVLDHDAFQASVNALYDGDPVGGKLLLEAKFCAICPEIAEWACGTASEDVITGEPLGGCGLLLCEKCKELLETVERGRAAREEWEGQVQVLDRLVDVARNVRYDEGLRADVEFLTSKGELMVRLSKVDADDDDYDDEDGDDDANEGNEGNLLVKMEGADAPNLEAEDDDRWATSRNQGETGHARKGKETDSGMGWMGPETRRPSPRRPSPSKPSLKREQSPDFQWISTKPAKQRGKVVIVIDDSEDEF